MPNDKLVKAKAEMFDLQVFYSQIKTKMEEKMKEINELQKEQNEDLGVHSSS